MSKQVKTKYQRSKCSTVFYYPGPAKNTVIRMLVSWTAPCPFCGKMCKPKT